MDIDAPDIRAARGGFGPVAQGAIPMIVGIGRGAAALFAASVFALAMPKTAEWEKPPTG